ncbi:MAG: hypothetical protein L6R40_001781 [Gallowayella cf. fulva]|nr:MAG: hypothetical protein L6R40_001781 [Xanthomendoza cf. fulva]
MLDIISKGATMIVGIDVTHPSPGSAETAPSVAGMVASVDKHLSQWPADLRIQANARTEMVSSLVEMLKTRLDFWRKKNKQLPESILIYRDGVSEGEYTIVMQNELPLLRATCEKVYKAEDPDKHLPLMTTVIVGKRHHTRFFPVTSQDKNTIDKTSNPVSGTVVDRHVTEARTWDFFLQSHNAIKGTARPAHYIVVLDEIFTGSKPPADTRNYADVLESLTYNLCFLFGRATLAVSICTPVYYAHLVCERARCYLAGHYDLSQSPQTPASSKPGGSGPGVLAQPTDDDVKVHENLKDKKFYI